MSIPYRYLPNTLSRRDWDKQKRGILRSRRLYKKGVYLSRPKLQSYKHRRSSHLRRAEEMYGVPKIKPSRELARATGCTQQALAKIVNKGRGAYYSSGSRPNQTAESWGLARLASAITGQKAARIDYHILKNGCRKTSRALRLAKKLV
jgi:Family of unknown function (DUF5824)